MKVKTLQAYSVNELDDMISGYLNNGWTLMGDMSTYRYKRQHAVHGYDVWETMFIQRMVKNDE